MSEDANFIKELLPKLSKPMPYKWRVQSFSKYKAEATCVAYIDARNVMDRLDECCIFGWERCHTEIKGHIYAGIGITLPSGRTIWKWDCGTESNTDPEKGESSDSFKRAGVNCGIGRFLYDLEIKRLPASDIKTKDNYPYVVDENNKRVWDITKYINEMPTKKPYTPKKKLEPIRNWIEEMNCAVDFEDMEGLKKVFAKAWESTTGKERDNIKKEYDELKAKLEGGK